MDEKNIIIIVIIKINTFIEISFGFGVERLMYRFYIYLCIAIHFLNTY